MNGSIRKIFEDLVKKYTKDAKDKSKDKDLLLEDLIDDLVEEAADHWYSSSAEC